jgi:hypothetical protein
MSRRICVQKLTWFILFGVTCLAVGNGVARGVELAVLTEENWDEFAPQGKEVDAIYGDYVLRNDKIVAVIARDVDGRNANMTVRNVGGCIIDLTLREEQSDQLSAYYPVMDRRLRLSRVYVGTDEDLAMNETFEGEALAQRLARGPLQAHRVSLSFWCEVGQSEPEFEVRYILRDGSDWIEVQSKYWNPHAAPIVFQCEESVRVDGEFEMGVDSESDVFWAYDAHWGQAYGVRSEVGELFPDLPSLERRRPILRYGEPIAIDPLTDPSFVRSFGQKRLIYPASDSVAVKEIARRGREQTATLTLHVSDANGPVADAEIAVLAPDLLGRGRTDTAGRWVGIVPMKTTAVEIRAQGREPIRKPVEFNSREGVAGAATDVEVTVPQPGYVAAKITDAEGREIPCKVAFHGRDGTPDPNFGPDSAIYGVQNLQYTPNGEFRIEIAPGSYDVVISHGPEYDAAFEQIEVTRGEETNIEAQLTRSVDTTGWLSADFHSHSTPSGDNTASQRGRVLNLLAEHVEFIPCTEHNRIDTYLPHLEHFNAFDRVATCSGMELTGQPLPINHQNAFPLKHTPRTQDGGGPVTDADPVVQIERLAMWDSGSEKLVQSNHPNIPQMVADRDFDGTPDEGFERMFRYMDVIEVHPPQDIFTPPAGLPPSDRELGNVIFHWMQLLNVGYRVPGVVNTDAHWNFHGSGWLRNYIKSPTDNPHQAQIMDLVHASEHGQIVMTNGPFLEVTATAGPEGQGRGADVGGDVAAPDGYVMLQIRVQCPNWHDVNRVQVFANGRPLEEHNYRRATHRDLFGNSVVKFSQTVQVKLDRDEHLIVATAGEGLTLGRVMGREHAEDMPAAVTNPIFVDVDGGGFKPNHDMLGVPLRLPEGLKPSHGHDH